MEKLIKGTIERSGKKWSLLYEVEMGKYAWIESSALETIARSTDGDLRTFYNLIEKLLASEGYDIRELGDDKQRQSLEVLFSQGFAWDFNQKPELTKIKDEFFELSNTGLNMLNRFIPNAKV